MSRQVKIKRRGAGTPDLIMNRMQEQQAEIEMLRADVIALKKRIKAQLGDEIVKRNQIDMLQKQNEKLTKQVRGGGKYAGVPKYGSGGYVKNTTKIRKGPSGFFTRE